jgi:predicted secreted protein
MAENAGKDVIVGVSTDGGSPTTVDGMNSVSLGRPTDMHDITHFNEGVRKRLAGLKDFTVQLSGNADYSDTGQNLIRTQEASDGDCYIHIAWDGSTYYEGQGLVSDISESASPDGTVETSFTIEGNGAWAAS